MLHTDDHLADLLNNYLDGKRRDIWLWGLLCDFKYNPGSFERENSNIRQRMIGILENNRDLLEKVRYLLNNQVLPDNSLKWIKEGDRQIKWITKKLAENLEYKLSNKPSNINGINLFLYILDTWDTDTTHKEIILMEIKSKWEEHKKGDKSFEWFKDNDKKVITARDWLNKNTNLLVNYQDHLENYNDLLIFFDNATITAEKMEIYLGKIKKLWSQQKYRENLKGKSQCNFVLSEKAIKNLDKLAIKHEISRAKILEILLEMETENNSYIPEKIRILKLLNNL